MKNKKKIVSFDFDNTITSFQFYSKTPWFQQLGINYEIGLDVFSVSLVLLNCFIGLIISLFNYNKILSILYGDRKNFQKFNFN